ncbi:MAG: hypothetical protein Q9224_002304 [Gallowayella concinna]
MYRKWWLKLGLGTNFPAVYGQGAAPLARISRMEHEKGSLVTSFLEFCKKPFSRRASSTNLLEKGDSMTNGSSPTSSFDAEKFPQIQSPTSIMAPIHIIQSHSDLVQDRPLPPIPAQSRHSSFKQHFTRARDFAPSDDIESALQRHEDHRPNRFIAGLWHANNAGDPTRMPTMHGACLGTPNGLRF